MVGFSVWLNAVVGIRGEWLHLHLLILLNVTDFGRSSSSTGRAKHLEELCRPVSIGYSFAISNGLGFARSISGVELVWIVLPVLVGVEDDRWEVLRNFRRQLLADALREAFRRAVWLFLVRDVGDHDDVCRR